jgi:hypothetical protein
LYQVPEPSLAPEQMNKKVSDSMMRLLLSKYSRRIKEQRSWISAIERDVNYFTFLSLSWRHVTFHAAAAAAKAADTTTKWQEEALSKLVIASTNA